MPKRVPKENISEEPMTTDRHKESITKQIAPHDTPRKHENSSQKRAS